MHLGSVLALLPSFGVLYVAGYAFEPRVGGPNHGMIFVCNDNLQGTHLALCKVIVMLIYS